MNTKQLNFAVSGETVQLIQDLKNTFGVESNAAVLKRALALAKLCAEQQREDHTITMLGKEERTIVLNV